MPGPKLSPLEVKIPGNCLEWHCNGVNCMIQYLSEISYVPVALYGLLLQAWSSRALSTWRTSILGRRRDGYIESKVQYIATEMRLMQSILATISKNTSVIFVPEQVPPAGYKERCLTSQLRYILTFLFTVLDVPAVFEHRTLHYSGVYWY